MGDSLPLFQKVVKIIFIRQRDFYESTPMDRIALDRSVPSSLKSSIGKCDIFPSSQALHAACNACPPAAIKG